MKTILYFYESAFMMWRRRLRGIFSVARSENWDVESCDVGELDENVRTILAYWKPDGIIVEGGIFRHRKISPAVFSNYPTVYCDADRAMVGDRVFGIRQDPEAVVREALRELMSLQLATYAYVHYRTPREWSSEREAIFRRVLNQRSQRGEVFYSWKTPRCKDKTAFDERLAAFLSSLQRPFGVLAANDEMAAHVLRVAKQARIMVPDEMAVVGVDNDELLCENTHPTLSSVAPAFECSGRLAAGLLALQLKNRHLNPMIKVFDATPLVRRHSTVCRKRTDIRTVHAMEYIRRNACRGLSVADVVQQMGLKARTAENRFREVAKHSIRDEIIAVRIARAKSLLREGRLAVNVIYHYCGYRDERSLRAIFKKATGLSPSAWRESHQGG